MKNKGQFTPINANKTIAPKERSNGIFKYPLISFIPSHPKEYSNKIVPEKLFFFVEWIPQKFGGEERRLVIRKNRGPIE